MQKNYFSFIYQYSVVFLFLGAFIVALFTYDHYGMSWDEPMQRKTGHINYDYIFSGDNTLLTWQDRDYGVAFELPLIIVEKALNLQDSREIHIMRHLITHCFFLIACCFLFLIIDYLYKNKYLATIGFFLLLLHPRIYAHSYFNTKDIPFLSMFIICLYYAIKAFDTKSISRYIGLGICVGILINLRIMGIMVLLVSLLTLIIYGIKNKDNTSNIILASVFVISCFLTLYATWPFLWDNPLENFATAFKNMSNFRWDNTVLFNGQLVKSTELSWTYIPIWFCITTPITYLVFGFLGGILLIYQCLKKPFEYINDSVKRSNVFFLGYFITPLIAVIVFQSTLYDGWRQMYFIYPPFILLCLYSIQYLSKFSKQISAITLVCICVECMLTLSTMVRSFPLQGSYFNALFYNSEPEYLRKNFELDYWGVSYKQALEYILDTDSSSSINISVENYPGGINVHMLPINERHRINIVSKEKSTYFITNYRWHPQDYEAYKNHTFYKLSVGKHTISEIFKIR